MASYISSNDNRFYAAVEPAYGQASAISAQSRIPAVKLATKQQTEKTTRKDKTGTRTFLGNPSGLRRTSNFSLSTYLTGWTDQKREPGYGALFEACLGGAALFSTGGTVASATSTRLAFAGSHNLSPGQAVSVGGEIRFVNTIVDSQTVVLNAPLTLAAVNLQSGATATYSPGSDLPSVTIYDYWSPATAVQRVICGAAVHELRVKVNGDFHEFTFSGGAADIIDSASFESGQGKLDSFPLEPALEAFDYSIIPGHLGQLWLGNTPNHFFTVTKAELTFQNELVLRNNEFGSMLPRGIMPGIRNVSLDLALFEQDDADTKALYQAARHRSPISMMLQLGQQQGQLFGVYMKGVVPEVPEFDDGEKRLQWHFLNCRAQGVLNDEIYIAFG